MRTLTFGCGVLALALSLFTSATAAIPVFGQGYTIGYGIGWLSGSRAHREGHAWSWWVDPSVNSLSGQVTIAYDPSKFTVLPDESGPAGLFSNDPSSAPPVNPSEFYGSFLVPALPGARPGNVWNLDISTPGIAVISFDLTANPVALDSTAGDVNFYALTVLSTDNLSGFLVNSTPTGDAFIVAGPSSSFMTCSAPGGASFACGQPPSTTFSQGLTARPVPEPETWILMLLGFGGLGCVVRGRRKSARASASFA
jgi:hypothetical protein